MAEPEFTITLENQAWYCRVSCIGRFSEKVFVHLVDMLRKDKAGSPPGKRYLIDVRRTEYNLDTFARFRLGEYGALQLGTSRIAVLSNPGQTDKMSENTAFNRGLQILVTHIPEEAEAWVSDAARVK